MESAKLKEIIENHEIWLGNNSAGERANLMDANLMGANLMGANLMGANLMDANLMGANLMGANLMDANLMDANLMDANLMDANLMDANLRRANLRRANLMGANLMDANLMDARLMDANLMRASLRRANLMDANLMDARGNQKEIKSILIAEEYAIVYTSEYLQIGCERYSIDDFLGFDDDAILRMDGDRALVFWKKYKDFIKSAIELSPATPTKKGEEE